MTSAELLPDQLELACRTGAWGAFEYPAGSSFGPVHMDDFEFVWVISGEATCTIVTSAGELRSEHLTPGVLLLVPPGTVQTYSWSPRGPTVHGFVHFRLTESAAEGAGAWPWVRAMEPGGTSAALCHEIVRLAPSAGAALSAGDVRTLEAACTLLLRLFVSGAPPNLPHPAHLVALERWIASQWRSAGPMTSLPLDRLAAAVNVSPGHLSRLTRTAFGVGPVAAVEAVRLHRAAALLTRSNLTVGQVAAACGFASPFYFSRRFRAAFGRPPTAYRRDPIARPPLPGQTAAQAAALASWCARTQSP
jgi:AraC family transcriptional regulator